MREKWFFGKKQEKEKTSDERMKNTEQDNIIRCFLPAALLQVIGVGTKTFHQKDLLSEQKEIRAVILSVNVSGFSDLIRGMEIKSIYRFINRTLSLCVPIIEQKGGMIDRFEDAGLLSFFTEEIEDGLNAAILICEKIVNYREQKTYRQFAACLCYGDVMTGVVGHGSKYAVLTLSAYTQFNAFMQKNAFRYYARILAAESYVRQIQGFEKKYHYRFLGIIYIRSLQKEEKIFDIFDGDDVVTRNKKRKTKMLFEKGVNLFLEKAFLESRAYFIEVLKADREDKAAREYVFLCDRYSSMTHKEQELADIYIDCL